MHPARWLFSLAALLVLVAAAAAAAEREGATLALFEEAPTVDGEMAPEEWAGALRIQGFQKHRGSLSDAVGAAWMGFTRERLYLAVVTELPPDGALRALEKEKPAGDDQLYGAGGIEIWIDANRGRRAETKESLPYIQFIGNAAGARYDKRYGMPGEPPNLGWDGKWEFENGIFPSTDEDSPIQAEHGIWVAELSIPFADLGLEKDPVGQTIGALIVRNWKRGRGGQMSWFKASGAYSDWARYPLFHLTEKAPVVQIRSLGTEIYLGRLDLETRIYNPAAEEQTVTVQAEATSSDMPGARDSQTLTLAPQAYTPYAFAAKNFHEHAQHKLALQIRPADEGPPVLNYTLEWQKPRREKWRTEKVGPQPEKAVRLEYYPSYEFVRVTVDPRKLEEAAHGITEATVSVLDPAGEEIVGGAMAWEKAPARQRFEVGRLPEGEYTARVTLTGYETVFERRFTRRYFVWEGNDLGITKRIYPPFEPVRVEENAVEVVMRRMECGGLGLWSSVQARGSDRGSELRELLAGPVALRVNDGAVLAGEGAFEETTDQRAIFRGSAVHPAVTVESECVTEYDGVQKVTLTLKPGSETQELQQLWLEIPLREAAAPLFHVARAGRIRENPAGSTPAGEGRVWDSRDLPTGSFYGNFLPYFWLGAEERGVSWFADNDRGWVLDARPAEGDPVPCQEILREDGRVVLRVNLVQKPVTLEEPREIVFGLMATPGKPMPENWRNVFFNSAPEENVQRIRWMAAQYWGSPSVMYSKLPIDQDTEVLSKLQEARVAGGGWDGFLRSWKERHLSGDISHKTYKSKEKILGLLKHAFRISRTASAPGDYLTAYWEEFHATHSYHPEGKIFKDEWKSHAYPRSYLDFALWCGAEFVRRGIGLYFDNCFPKPTFDPITTAAYELPNGRTQPSANVWRHREYLRRIWVIHQQLAPAATKPIMMLHMTNSHLPVYMVYGDTNLDLEWLYGPGAAQSKYPHDLLRAESLGLKSGSIPTALAGGSHRTKFGALMVHEIRAKFKRVELFDILGDFGYGQPDAEVYNYWDEAPALSTSDPECKWLLVKRNGELMALFCTWNAEAAEVRVSLATDAIGVSPATADNVEEEGTMPVKNGTFTFSMPGHGVRLFRLQ